MTDPVAIAYPSRVESRIQQGNRECDIFREAGRIFPAYYQVLTCQCLLILTAMIRGEGSSHGERARRFQLSGLRSLQRRLTRAETDLDSPQRDIRLYGLFLLTGAKLADTYTTVVGLLYVPGVIERNHLVRAVLDGFGVLPGLMLLTAVTVGFAALAAEGIATRVRRRDGLHRLAATAQITVYLVLSVHFSGIALYNTGILSAYLLTAI